MKGFPTYAIWHYHYIWLVKYALGQFKSFCPNFPDFLFKTNNIPPL